MTISLGYSQNLISNSYFTSGGTGWNINGPGTFTGGEAVFPNTAAGGNPWDNELKQTGKTLISNATYTLTFRARAAANRTMSVNIQNTNIWNDHFRNNSVALTTTMTIYSYTFTATSVNNNPNNVQLNFHVAGTGSTAAVYIDDVTLVAGTTTQCTNFIQDGDETGVDCGGSTCGPCLINPTFNTFTIASKFLGDAAFTVAATSDSPGAITYTSSDTAVATINSTSGLITIVGPGTTTITANQAASGGYYAGSTTATLTVTPPEAPVPPARNTWDVVSLYSNSYSPTSGATWQNGTDVSISGNNARFFNGFTLARLAFATTSIAAMTTLHIDVYTLNQNQLWFEINGNRKVVSSIPLNGWASFDIPLSDYVGLNLSSVNFFDLNNPTGSAAPVKQVYLDNIYFYRAATLQPPTIGSFTVPSKVVGDAPFTLTNPSSNSSGAWTYTSSNTNVATISGNTVTVVGGGISTITATQASDGTYGAATVTAQFSVLPPAAPTPPARVATDVISYYSGSYTPEATPTWASNNSNSDVSLGGNNARFVSSFTFGQIAFAAKNVSTMSHIHVDIYSLDATLLWLWVGTNRRDINVTPNAWTSIDIPLSQYSAIGVNLSSVNVVKIENPLGAGTLRNMYVDNIYFYFTLTTPTISNFPSVAKVMGAAPFTLSATSDSPAAITYTSSNPAVATVSGNTVTVVGVGTSTLTASQVATGVYSAGSATATLTVTGSTIPLTGPTAPPARNSWDVFSVFSDAYTPVAGTRNYNPGWGQAGSASVVAIAGDNTWRATNLNYQGLDFGSNINVSAMTTFHVDVWTFDETSLQFFQINNGGGERSYTLTPLVQGQWNSYDIPITAWTSQSGFLVNNLFQFKVVGSGGKTVYFDNMYFYRPATTQPPTLGTFTVPSKLVGDAPFTLTPPTSNSAGAFTYTSSNTAVATISGNTVTVVGAGTSTITATQAADGSYGTGSTTATLSVTPPAAPTPPARNTWDVVSFYSGAYTNSSTPTWGGQTSDVSISGNTTRLFTNFLFGQIAFAATDVSAMTWLHVDVFSLDQTPLWFWLGNQRVILPTPINGWTSLDIPLSSYSSLGVNLATVNIFKIENPNGAGGLRNAYVDNIYFYRNATLPPATVGTFTVPAKVLGDAPFQLTPPTSNNTSPFTYTSSNTAVATISGDMVTVVGGGSSTITASQVADGTYGPTSKTATLVVTYPAPGPSPIPPARDPAKVMSVYTGTPAQVYANSPAYTLVRSTWTGATTANFNFANGTNTCIQVNNLGFIGLVDQTERRLNVTTMSHLHLDVYVNTPLSNLFVFLLAPGDRNYSTGPLTTGWNSLSIPLTAYPGALNDIYGFKIEQNVAPNTTQIYLDNIYFSNDFNTYYADSDGDGYGNLASTTSATSQPVGYVTNSTDCNDGDSAVWRTDNFYIDFDGDGYSFDNVIQPVCYGLAPESYYVVSSLGLDCNDGDPTIWRSALLYDDVDGDGYNAGSAVTCYGASLPTGTSLTTLGSGDCDDTNANINPARAEICYNNIDDNCNGQKSENTGPSCPAVPLTVVNPGTITNFSNSLSCLPYTYAGATSIAYRIEIERFNNGVSTGAPVTLPTQSSRFFFIPTNMRSFTNNGITVTYKIRASAVINEEEVAYALPTITVNSYAIPKVKLTSCPTALSSIGATISANPGFNATDYSFRIRLTSDTAPSPTYYYINNSASRFVNSNSFAGLQLQYGTSYQVSVNYRLLNNGNTEESGWGDECTMTTPTIPLVSLASPVCGTQVTSLGAGISAYPATYADRYKFRIRKASESTYYYTAELTSRFSNLSAFGTTLSYNTPYLISVQYRLSTSGNEWSDFGPECSITTPFYPTVDITCNPGITSLTQSISFGSYIGFPTYKIRLIELDSNLDPIPSSVQYITRTYTNFTLSMFTTYPPVVGKNYNADVAVILNGIDTEYGRSCTILTVAPLRQGAGIKQTFTATAYPNPFANNFMLDVKSSSSSMVNVKVYDMLGRLIEQKDANVADMATTTIGERYPSGVYNVVVSQEDNVQTMKVVKR